MPDIDLVAANAIHRLYLKFFVSDFKMQDHHVLAEAGRGGAIKRRLFAILDESLNVPCSCKHFRNIFVMSKQRIRHRGLPGPRIIRDHDRSELYWFASLGCSSHALHLSDTQVPLLLQLFLLRFQQRVFGRSFHDLCQSLVDLLHLLVKQFPAWFQEIFQRIELHRRKSYCRILSSILRFVVCGIRIVSFGPIAPPLILMKALLHLIYSLFPGFPFLIRLEP